MEGRTTFDRNRMVESCVSAGSHFHRASSDDAETISGKDLCYKQGSNEDAFRHYSCSMSGFVWPVDILRNMLHSYGLDSH